MTINGIDQVIPSLVKSWFQIEIKERFCSILFNVIQKKLFTRQHPIRQHQITMKIAMANVGTREQKIPLIVSHLYILASSKYAAGS